MYETGDESVKPNARTYNLVISAWASSNTRLALRKTNAIIEHMWARYKAGDKDLLPGTFAYDNVINAVSSSRTDNKAQKALRILRQMDILYRKGGNKTVRPTEFTYTSVLNSCYFDETTTANSRIKARAFDTAKFTFEELCDSPYGNPNHVTYGMFLKVCANLIPTDEERRRSVVEPVFLRCCKDGQVGEIVLTHLRTAAPEDLYNKLLRDVAPSGGRSVRLEDLPMEWRCNVKEDQRYSNIMR